MPANSAKIYERPSSISEPVGNNAFGRHAGRPNVLRVPERVFGRLSDVRPGRETAFREFDASGNVVEYVGLERFVSFDWHGISVHAFDNHNHALAFWCEAMADGIFERGATLVHVDMHSDLWSNGNDLDLSRAGNAAYVESFVNEKTLVGTYVQPAMRAGMFSTFVRIEGEGDLLRERTEIENGAYGSEVPFESVPSEFRPNLVLNLDLDFFAPDLDDVPLELKKSVILAFARRARLVTVATSPCFVDQGIAIAKLAELFGPSANLPGGAE